MTVLRFLARPTTALWAAAAVVTAFVAMDLSAHLRRRGPAVLEVAYERVSRDAAGGERRLVETGTHFIADDGRYRRDTTALVGLDGGAIDERTTEIWLPPEGGGLDAWTPAGIRAELGMEPRAPAERITINHDLGRAVRGPLELLWRPPSVFAALLPGGPVLTPPELARTADTALTSPELARTPREAAAPFSDQSDNVDLETLAAGAPQSLGEKTIGPMVVHGRRQVLPLPDSGPITIEFWEAAQPLSWNPLPIVVERYVNDETGSGEYMRVTSAARTTVAAGFFDVPAGYRVQDLRRHGASVPPRR